MKLDVPLHVINIFLVLKYDFDFLTVSPKYCTALSLVYCLYVKPKTITDNKWYTCDYTCDVSYT